MKDIIEELSTKLKEPEQSKYKKQHKQLTSILDRVEGLKDNLAALGCFIAGGAITSIFTNKEVNDLDIYFRSKEDLKCFIQSTFNGWEETYPENGVLVDTNFADLNSFSLRYVGHTSKSIMFKAGEQDVQLIHTQFYQSSQEIFDTFDFHLNMGCYDCKEDVFVLSNSFLTDNMSKSITINPKTSFPIISQLRLDKYKQRGYSINRKEFILLALSVASLELNSWQDVKNAIGGMYGYCVDDIFKEDVEFSKEEMYSQLIELEYNDNIYKPVEEFGECDEILEYIDDCHEGLEPQAEYYYYKNVRSSCDEGKTYRSHYSPSFTYTVGEKVQDVGRGIFLYKTVGGAKDHNRSGVVIKLKKEGGRAKLTRDGSKGKYSTNDELIVVGEVDVVSES